MYLYLKRCSVAFFFEINVENNAGVIAQVTLVVDATNAPDAATSIDAFTSAVEDDFEVNSQCNSISIITQK